MSLDKPNHYLPDGIRTLAVLFASLFVTSSGLGQVFKTQQEALRQAFPESSVVTREVLFLTNEQVDEIQKSARTRIESKLVTYYVGSKADSITGCAFFETAVVRTKQATLMVVVAPDGTVKKVDILAFYEPLDYLPTARWLTLFEEKTLNDNLWPRRDIHQISGATLTVQAVTLAVRKILATYKIAVQKEISK